MNIVQATLQIYSEALGKTARATVRNWPVALVTPVYFAILAVASMMLSPLGMLGGFLLRIVQAACFSSYLYLLDEVARESGRANLADFKKGFGTYLWDIIGVLFVLWIGELVVTSLLRALPYGRLILNLVGVVAALALNVIPELLYQGRSRSAELIVDSARFAQENLLEWFLPVLSLSALLLLLHPAVLTDPIRVFTSDWTAILNTVDLLMTLASRLTYFVTSNPLFGLVLIPPALFGFFFLMVFRGFLFRALAGSTRRSRLFRQRMGY